MKHKSRQIANEEVERVQKLYETHRGKLEEYGSLLLWWNKKINLVSRDVSRETVLSHIKHSLCASLSSGFLKANHIIDTGAGGGLPGLPLSICFPEKTFIINDIVSKKVFAVNDMINKLGLRDRVSGLAADIRLVDVPERAVIITKHAFKLDHLYKLNKEKPWESMVFLKGYKEAEEEVVGIKDEVEMSLIELDSAVMETFFEGKGVVELKRTKNE